MRNVGNEFHLMSNETHLFTFAASKLMRHRTCNLTSELYQRHKAMGALFIRSIVIVLVTLVVHLYLHEFEEA